MAVPFGTFYKQNPDWADVKPIYENENEKAAVHINTSEHFIDVFAFFRAILKSGEESERALELTADCIAQNAANYTVWQVRRRILKALKKDLRQELNWSENVVLDNPKNYQVWHHRRCIAEIAGIHDRELALTDAVIRDENKNYHAWQHRQWTVAHFQLANQEELKFAMLLIVTDPRNNSAWHHRYSVLEHMNALSNGEQLAYEINLAQRQLSRIACNESAWNYLTAILSNVHDEARLVDVELWAKQLWKDRLKADQIEREKAGEKADDVPATGILAADFVVFRIVERVERTVKSTTEEIDLVYELFDYLAARDPIRKAYWSYERRRFDTFRLNNKLLGES